MQNKHANQDILHKYFFEIDGLWVDPIVARVRDRYNERNTLEFVKCMPNLVLQERGEKFLTATTFIARCYERFRFVY